MCKALIEESSRLRALAQTQRNVSSGADLIGHAQTMMTKVDQILAIMANLAPICPLMGTFSISTITFQA